MQLYIEKKPLTAVNLSELSAGGSGLKWFYGDDIQICQEGDWQISYVWEFFGIKDYPWENVILCRFF